MGVGGKRAGAGRKPGAAWAGPRPAPIRDMARSRVRELLTTKLDPLAVLVELANDETLDPALRIEAAQSACPFLFPRLSAAVVATAPMSAREDTARLVERLSARFARLVGPAPTIEATALDAVEASA